MAGIGGIFKIIAAIKITGTRNKSGLVLKVPSIAVFTFTISIVDEEKS